MKKLSILFAFLLCFSFSQPTVSALSVSAQYACVLDAQTGRVIFEKNARERHSMASTTKIMTALVALENSGLDDLVTVSKNAAGTECPGGIWIPISGVFDPAQLTSRQEAHIWRHRRGTSAGIPRCRCGSPGARHGG